MIYFISDVHLGLFSRDVDKKREDSLLQFLKKIEKDCKTLVIVGDFFDYWFEWNLVIPKYFYRTLTALHNLREKGIEILYIMGNHDFGHKDFFKNELDIEVYPNDLEKEFYGKKFFLYHGDGLSNNDGAYRVIKKILRSKFNLKLYTKFLHPDRAISLASGTSKKSRNYTDKKDYGEIDGMTEFAEKKIKEGFDYVIFGHLHRLRDIKFDTGRYINLGSWLNNAHFGKFDGGSFELLKVNDFLKNIEEN